MPKFRKKPVVIEAFQMTKERRWDMSKWPSWLQEAWASSLLRSDPNAPVMKVHEVPTELTCSTPSGVKNIKMDDWIIQGIKGELYPCHPDTFKAEYEAVSDDETDTDARTVLRAKLAGQALCGLLAGGHGEQTPKPDEQCKYFAAEAVRVADAVMDRLDNTATPPQ